MIGILGNGEIGKSIAKFYDKVLIRDLDINQFEKLEFLHICIPYSKDFIKIVSENIETYEPYLVIIHSTVPVGTTKILYDKYKNIVHSPCRGVHPNLYEGIKTFIKYIGADHAGIGRLVAEHYEKIGIKGEVVRKSETTELLKLLDTTYYGLAIAYHDYADKLCEKLGLNFDIVMTHANNSYNEGYMKLGKPEVIRPILYPPKGKIKGHCVRENSILLKKQFGKHKLLDAIIDIK